MKDYQVVEAILYRFKNGRQWWMLPMKQFFKGSYRWQSVYYQFQKWSKDDSWTQVWQNILCKYSHLLDLSSIQLDVTHTTKKCGGEAVGYQGKKKSNTSNILILTDQGIPLACIEPISGNHNDAFDLVFSVKKIFADLMNSSFNMDGLFFNADAGFDTEEFRRYCSENEVNGNIDHDKRNATENEYLFDDLLYNCRFVIERTNAWLDAFKAFLIRFETNAMHCKAMNLLAFCIFIT